MSKEKLIEGLDTIIVRVRDLGKAEQWYADKLGLAPLWRDDRLVVLDTYGPTSLTIFQTPDPIPGNRESVTFPIFKTSDASSLHMLLRQQNVETGDLVSDEQVIFFRFYDPDGNVLEACQLTG